MQKNILKSKKDLENYSLDDLKILGKYIGIKNTSKPNLINEIATKLIYSNSENLPRCKNYTIDKKCLYKVHKKIYRKYKKYENSIIDMTPKELEDIFYIYDTDCFNGELKQYLKEKKYPLKFKIDGENTFTTEGICVHNTCNYSITIPLTILERAKGITNVAGFNCKNKIECLYRVMEHEITHLIIFIFCSDTYITDQHGTLFMNKVNNMFGHTDHRHHIH